MSNIILQPTGNKDARQHYEDTIVDKIDITVIKPFVDALLYNDISEIYTNGKIPIWGVTNGKNNVNKKKWEKIKPGDVTLFCQNKRIYKTAVTTMRFHNKELALAIWGINSDNETWENIYLLDELQNIELTYESFNKIVGYKVNNIIQGFTYLDDYKSALILNSLELYSEIYIETISEREFKDEISRLQKQKSLDNSYNGTSRKEQSYLRKALFHNRRSAKCSICGKEYPVDLLVAAHIKKRAECTNEERLDVKNIVVPMCKLGCDDLYEKGYILVDEGIIKINNNKWIPKSVKEYLSKLVNTVCKDWNEGTEKYFKEHTNKFIKIGD